MNPFCSITTALEPQQIALPTVIIAGLTDGINPCAIGMLIFLLGYLIVFIQKPEKVLKTGLIYILTVFLTYFAIGFFFYSTVSLILTSTLVRDLAFIFRLVLSFGLIIFGLLNLKDVFGILPNVRVEISPRFQPRLEALIEKGSLPATALLAILVTLLETPCSLPLYTGAVTILSQCSLSSFALLGYLALYNLLFVFPLIVILGLVVGGFELRFLKEWQHKNYKAMKLVMGLLLLSLGLGYLLLWR